MSYVATVGVETHVELNTASKMFCGCSARFGDPPNTNVCPVCLGLPGALPVPNRAAIERIIAIGLALGCRLNGRSIFHRKNYFYADMPKNYQISQYDIPVFQEGAYTLETEKGPHTVRINRVHMEEDTGKSLHVGHGGRIHGAEYTLLDFNRAGVPLVEIVTEPDLRSPEEARQYATELRDVLLTLGVSDVKLEEGSLRFDANVSVRAEEEEPYGVKVEVKNMNSFRSLEQAIGYEIERQVRLLTADQAVVQETRHWDEEEGLTHGMRSKEESSDYRYFPEPDLVPIAIDEEWISRARAALPELPFQRRERLRSLGLDSGQANTLIRSDPVLVGWLTEAVERGADPGVVANWLTGEVTGYLRREELEAADTHLDGARLARLVGLVSEGKLSATAAKEVLALVAQEGGDPLDVAREHDLIQLSEGDELVEAVDRVISDHPEEFARLEGGEERLVGFFVGLVMRATAGRADPKAVTALLRERIS